MSIRRAWRWAVADFKRGLAAHDPSKLMIAPILFFGVLAVVDRSFYDIERQIDPDAAVRMTRL